MGACAFSGMPSCRCTVWVWYSSITTHNDGELHTTHHCRPSWVHQHSELKRHVGSRCLGVAQSRIDTTVRDLSPLDAGLLLGALVTRFQAHKGLKAPVVLPWLNSLFVHHLAYFGSAPGDLPRRFSLQRSHLTTCFILFFPNFPYFVVFFRGEGSFLMLYPLAFAVFHVYHLFSLT